MKSIKKMLLILSILSISLMFNSCSNDNVGKNELNKPNDSISANQNYKETITSKELFVSNNARLAMALVLDKSYITDSILGNGAIPAGYLIPKEFVYDMDGKDFRDTSPDGYQKFDIEKAKEYWQKAKEEIGFKNVTISLLTSDSDLNKRIAEYIQGQWNILEGLNVEINQVPFKTQLDNQKKGDFDTAIAGWSPDYADPMTFMDLWVETSEHNYAKYKNKDYNKLVMEAKNGDLTNVNKLDERMKALKNAEKIILQDDVAIIPLFQKGVSILQREGVENIIRAKVAPGTVYKFAKTKYKDKNEKYILRLTDSSDLVTANTIKTTDTASSTLLGTTNEGLLNILDNGKIDYCVAESYEVSEDSLEYTFKLRKDAKWENGKPVTAKDFVFAWRKLSDPKTGAQYSGLLETANILNASKIINSELLPEDLGVEAVDDYTLKVKLEKPVPYFLSLLSMTNFYPINEEFYNQCGDKFGTSKEYTLSNGAFKLESWDLGYGYSVVKNDNYWNKDNIHLDGITWRKVQDSSATLNLYEKGEVDICGLTGDGIAKYEDSSEFMRILSGSMFYVVINLDK